MSKNLFCFMFYCRGLDFRNSGDFSSVAKRTVLLINYYLGGRQNIDRDYYIYFPGLQGTAPTKQ